MNFNPITIAISIFIAPPIDYLNHMFSINWVATIHKHKVNIIVDIETIIFSANNIDFSRVSDIDECPYATVTTCIVIQNPATDNARQHRNETPSRLIEKKSIRPLPGESLADSSSDLFYWKVFPRTEGCIWKFLVSLYKWLRNLKIPAKFST